MEPVATVTVEDVPIQKFRWTPAVAGALVAAALAFVLHSFASAIGIAVSSTSPTWRDTSFALQFLAGLYLVTVAIVSFGAGGYIAGRLRSPIGGSSDEIEFRDGTLGLMVWAIAVILTVLLTGIAAQLLARATTSSADTQARSVVGERLVAYELDRLFRAEKRPTNIDLDYARSEAARILLTSAGHSGIPNDDRTYLARLTASSTGLAIPEAQKRVDTVLGQARDSIRKARRSAVILAFMLGAASLLGAAVAWFAAGAGGRHRDGSVPSMTWGWAGPRSR